MAAKIFDIFRNLKSDAVPRPPRPEAEDVFNENDSGENDNVYNNEESEDIYTDLPKKEKKKSSFNNNFFKPNKKKDSFGSPKKGNKDDKQGSNSNVNVQATGNVINIVNSRDVHWGNEVVYYMGPTNVQQKQPKEDKEDIEKNNLIELVMESTVQPTHEYMDYISKNLGKNWQNIFLSLGYSKNRIETFEIDEGHKGISEVRYKILLDWVRNDDEGTLGKLVKILWREGERQLVKELSIIHKKNNE
ncbi:protein immune deficiency [Battus philenor]|uniref:protein immune deficiency n=1 Tax=Battus philenor TaxID=42288 RepID=UPI0035CFA787